MNTFADVANEINGEPMAMYVSPEYGATLARGRKLPTSKELRIHYVLMVFAHETASSGDPRLIITSEIPESGGGPVLGIYDESGHITLCDEGDWNDVGVFGGRAVELASQRLGTVFKEHTFRGKIT